jgi:hypothetical protein
MEQQRIFFSKKQFPLDFTEIADELTAYFAFLEQESLFEFDEVGFEGFPAAFERVHINLLLHPRFSMMLAQALLDKKMPQIKKRKRKAAPDLWFKENTGLNLFLHAYRNGKKVCSYYINIGGSTFTLLMESFENNALKNDQYLPLFKEHCLYLQPDHGHVAVENPYEDYRDANHLYGWANYFSANQAMPHIPKEYATAPFENIGTLVLLKEQQISLPSYYLVADEIEKLLQQRNIQRRE